MNATLPTYITDAKDAEAVHAVSVIFSELRCNRIATYGMRAVRDKDVKVMACLQQQADRMHHVVEAQVGQTNRSGSRSIEQTELGLWRSAFESAERDEEPNLAFVWLYAAAAWRAGKLPLEDHHRDMVDRRLHHAGLI